DFVLARGTYHDLFLVSAFIALAALLASIPLREPERPRAAAGAGAGFLGALRQRDLLPIWVVGSLVGVAGAGVYTFVKMLVEQEHVGTVGLFFTAYALSAIVLRVFFGWVPDRFGIKRTLLPAVVAYGVALAILALAHDTTTMMIAGILAGF